MKYDFARIARDHDRASFRCGDDSLDSFLLKFARQNDQSDIGRTWVACEEGSKRVVGYYTLSMASVSFENVPELERSRLPRYPIPVAHLGRLAVDQSAQGTGLGETLLMHALRQVALVSELVAVRAIEVKAKSAGARTFYERYGFVSLLDEKNHLYLSIRVVRRLLETTG